MNPEEHARFTDELLARVSALPQAVGLVALGSMSGEPPLADAFSDHDFFVVTQPGAQEHLRQDLSWLAAPERIALAYRETGHGVNVLLVDGHLLEFAVFDLEELRLARVNRFRVLLDRGGVLARMHEVRAETVRRSEAERSGEDWLVGQFLVQLVTGSGRFARGERLAGHARVKGVALQRLLELLGRAAPNPAALDNLDPVRRFEQGSPELSARLERALALDTPDAAIALFRIAHEALSERIPPRAAQAVLQALERARAG
jgi:hypothetical protein